MILLAHSVRDRIVFLFFWIKKLYLLKYAQLVIVDFGQRASYGLVNPIARGVGVDCIFLIHIYVNTFPAYIKVQEQFNYFGFVTVFYL